MNIELYEKILEEKFELKITEQMEIDNITYVKEGKLIRRRDKHTFPIRNFIPRFVNGRNYADSFGYQWNKFKSLQHDSKNGRRLTEKRLLDNTKWGREKMPGKTVLECGCGPGRFTEVFYRMGADIVTVDMSNAIDVNLENLGLHPNVLYIQDDITKLHYMKSRADYVFCYGVLQHTPNPRLTLHRLSQYVKPDGRISIDIYLKMSKPNPFYGPKYFWRPITKRMDKEKLLDILKTYIPKYIKFDTWLRPKTLLGVPLGEYILGLIPIPCWNYLGMGYSDQERIRHAVMDTFDALSPEYDKPCSCEELGMWAEAEKYKKFKVAYGSNGLVLNAKR